MKRIPPIWCCYRESSDSSFHLSQRVVTKVTTADLPLGKMLREVVGRTDRGRGIINSFQMEHSEVI